MVKYGSQELKERFLPDFLTGKKRTCIAITEPDAGSDVANITTTAGKTSDGKYYIINGAKKWHALTLPPNPPTPLFTQQEAVFGCPLTFHGI